MGYMAGKLETIEELLSAHIEVSREERDSLKKELSDLKTEITRYKWFVKGIVGTIVAIATFKFGDIATIWGG